MKIAVIGTGYVGLVVGTCLADSGNDVICVDKIKEKIDLLNSGKVPIYEPGLEELIKKNMREGRLHFSTDIGKAIKQSEIIFIAVGTPQLDDGSANLSYVLEAAEEIAKNINEYKLIVTKSTVPVGTQKKIKKIIATHTNYPFDVASNPEFLKEGAAVDDFMKPDRIIIGVESERAEEILKELYAPFVRTEHPIIVMDPESAEMTKYASNAMLATKISFINEIANICEKVGADVELVRKGMGFDKRIGFLFLFPGIGFGGSCFPKDIKAVIKMGEEKGYDPELIRAVNNVNNKQKKKLVEKAINHFGSLKGLNFALWGLAFKPRTDDMREAPSITIINMLLDNGATITAFDPAAVNTAKEIFGNKIKYVNNPYDALIDKDALFIITEWNEFRNPDFHKIKELLKKPVIFDGRNLYNLETMKKLGFTYYGIGRPPVLKEENIE